MTRRRWSPMIVIATGILVVACATPPPDKATATDPGLTLCEDPRPQICTAHYDPVCGVRGDGVDKTYANACSACGDPAVSGHRPGACE